MMVKATRRGSNADLIADLATLGYFDDDPLTLDATWGRGKFWTAFRPTRLVSVDRFTKALVLADNRNLPFREHQFGVVVFDPPYKLSGTPSLGDFDNRYGVDKPLRWQDRHQAMKTGMLECLRVLRPGGYLMFKCQNQVCSGQIRWQTDRFTVIADLNGATKVEQLELLGGGRPQPMAGRTQKHAHGRPSTLMVFQVPQDANPVQRSVATGQRDRS